MNAITTLFYITVHKLSGFPYTKYVHTNSHQQQVNEELSFVT